MISTDFSAAEPFYAANKKNKLPLTKKQRRKNNEGSNMSPWLRDPPLVLRVWSNHSRNASRRPPPGKATDEGNFEGGTPLAVARAQGHNKVAALLERAGATE